MGAFAPCLVSAVSEWDTTSNAVTIQNLRNWSGSVLCIDRNGALFERTAEQRKAAQAVFRFDPFAEETHRCNPLGLLSQDAALCASELESITRIFWARSKGPASDFKPGLASDLFQGAVLYMRDGGDAPSLGQVRKICNLFVKFDSDALARFADSRREERLPIAPRTLRLLGSFCALPLEVREAVLDVFNKGLAAMEHVEARTAMDADDFNFVASPHRAQSVYLCAPSERWAEAAPLFNLIVTQALRAHLRVPVGELTAASRLLLILDDTTSLGVIDLLVKQLDQLAAHDISVLMTYPSQQALRDVYGEAAAKKLTEACACRVLLPPDNTSEAIVAIKGQPMQSIRRFAD